MNRIFKFGVILALLVTGACRATPNKVRIINITGEEYRYKIEEYYGKGPVSSDYTRIYLENRLNSTERILVASGDYLQISRIIGLGKHTVVLCRSGGNIDRFRRKIAISDWSGMESLTVLQDIKNCSNYGSNYGN